MASAHFFRKNKVVYEHYTNNTPKHKEKFSQNIKKTLDKIFHFLTQEYEKNFCKRNIIRHVYEKTLMLKN